MAAVDALPAAVGRPTTPAWLLLLSLLSALSAADAEDSAGVADTDGGDDDVVVVSPAGTRPNGANMVAPGTDIWSAESCWRDGSHFAYESCCCGQNTRPCWLTERYPFGIGGGGGVWSRRTCCIWQHGPGQMCLNGTWLRLHLGPAGLLGLRAGPPARMCHVSTDRNARWLAETAFLPSLSEQAQRGSLRVADLGAGVGLESVVLALLGHRPVALDYGACQVRMIRENARLNGVGGLPVVRGDLRNTSLVAEALLERSGGRFDVVTAWGMGYLQAEVFAALLDVVDAIAAEGFVWPMPCSRDAGDLWDAQRITRRLAATRFELVDSAFFLNVGNPWSVENLLGLTRVCFLQRRERRWTYRYPRMARASAGGAERLRRERGRRGAMYNQVPGHLEVMMRRFAASIAKPS